MSVQAGLWFFDGRPVDETFLSRVGDTVAEYGPDGCVQQVMGPIGMTYRPFHTTAESKLQSQPYVSRRGNVFMWDGRLDNREELSLELSEGLRAQSDVEIVAAAYDRWGSDCFSRLLGDWAVTAWDSQEKHLLLARDYSGIRHLFYLVDQQRVFWCSHLAALVQLAGTRFTLCDEYVAGYLIRHAAANLTPYREILSVPPANFVKIRNGRATSHPACVFRPQTRIQYKTDAEYEEHFRTLFRQAVRRRLRSDSPVLAELSGGYDSSSVVCMADDILARDTSPTPRLDTLSFHDSTEAGMDDHLYFTKVEEQRGQRGFHFDLGGASRSPLRFDYSEFAITPSSQDRSDAKCEERRILEEGGYRVVLTGTGGDEFAGGAADPKVHMGDLMAQWKIGELARELKAWSLVMKHPWMRLCYRVWTQLLPPSLRAKITREAKLESSFEPDFARRYKLRQLQLGLLGKNDFKLPSQRDAVVTVHALANQMSDRQPWVQDIRYPFLDRNLVEFLTSIPQSQLLRPGQWRSLMRRALAGIVPREVLTRKTKGAAGGCYIRLIDHQWEQIEKLFQSPLTERFGYFDAPRFRRSLFQVKNGNITSRWVQLVKGVQLEYWLQDVTRRGIVAVPSEKISSGRMDLAQSRA